MTRVNGKNNMRTPKEKEMWVIKYLNGEIGLLPGARQIGIQVCVFKRWINKIAKKNLSHWFLAALLIESSYHKIHPLKVYSSVLLCFSKL